MSHQNCFFCKKYSKNWTCFWVWLKELNLFEHDSKNWTFFEHDSQKWTFFQHYLKDGTFESMTQRIGHLIWLKVLNLWTFFFFFLKILFFFTNEPFSTWLKELNLLFYMTPRTEPFLLEELNFFFSNLNQRIDFFKNFTSNYWPFFEYDSQNWTLLTRLKDLEIELFSTWVKEQ